MNTLVAILSVLARTLTTAQAQVTFQAHAPVSIPQLIH